MKKTFSIALLTTLLINIFSAVCYADDSDILNRDFDNGDTSKINKSATVTIVDGGMGESLKCLSFGSAGDMARFMFSDDNSYVVNGGKICAEFDVRIGFGGIGMGVFTKDDTNFGNYHKAVFSSGTKNSTPARGLKAYTTIGAKQHPNGNAGSESYIKGYRASGSAVDMSLAENKWQHVKLEIDMDNARTRLTIDDTQSEYITGFTYLSDIIGIGFKWSPAGLNMTNATDAQKEAYIDNIRIYYPPAEVSKISLIKANGKENSDFSKVSPKTAWVKISFSESMNYDSVLGAVSLYDVTNSKDIAITATEQSADGKEITFAIDEKGLAENTEYKITVSACEASNGIFTVEYEKYFTTVDLISAERISYYSADFESDTVGETPKNVLGQADSSKNFAVVKESDGNKYISTSSRARFLFNESVTSGTVSAEFDVNFTTGGSGFGIVYSATPAAYSKWPLGFTGAGKIIYYDALGANPTSVLSGHTFNLEKENSTEQMSFDVNEWQHIKLLMDVDNKKITVYVNDEKSSETSEIPFIAGSNGIGGIVFYSSNTAEILLDNVNVYRTEAGVLKTEITNSNGAVLSDDKIPSSAKNISITFTNSVADDADVSLESNLGSENVIKTWDGLNRTLTLTPEKGYFDSNADYTLTVRSGYTDVFGQISEADYTYSFKTDEGGFNILGLNLIKNGVEIADLNGVSAGDNIAASVNYVLTKPEQKKDNVILAAVFENDGRLVYMAKNTVNLDKLGNNAYTLDMTLPDGISFDTAYVYLWDLQTRAPIILNAFYTK